MTRLNHIVRRSLGLASRLVAGVLAGAQYSRALAVEEATVADVHAAFLSGRGAIFSTATLSTTTLSTATGRH